LLQHVSASQGHHEKTFKWSKSLHCMGSHVNIFTCYYCMSSYSRMCTRTFLMLFPCCGVHAVSLCVVFLGRACVPLHYRRKRVSVSEIINATSYWNIISS
jgi:hypothetical protein